MSLQPRILESLFERKDCMTGPILVRGDGLWLYKGYSVCNENVIDIDPNVKAVKLICNKDSGIHVSIRKKTFFHADTFKAYIGVGELMNDCFPFKFAYEGKICFEPCELPSGEV